MHPEPLVAWPEVLGQYVQFASLFAMLGALGFRLGVVPRAFGANAAELRARAEQRAARIGLTGALLGVVTLAMAVLRRAAARHLAVAQVVAAGGGMFIAQCVLLALLLIGFALALRRRGAGWGVAAAAVLALELRNVVSGRWQTVINPLHVIGASLWIGTLFVMVAAGLTVVLSGSVPHEQRGWAAAALVNAFSPLALSAATLLVCTGLVTATLHLKYIAALWTTPYGYTFIAKLCVVAVVVGLGAWNWRRVKPTLGEESAARTIKRSATAELTAATVVLLITGVLVSLPVPRAPKRPASAPAAAAPATTPATASRPGTGS
jgi:putative copper resistance protein D